MQRLEKSIKVLGAEFLAHAVDPPARCVVAGDAVGEYRFVERRLFAQITTQTGVDQAACAIRCVVHARRVDGFVDDDVGFIGLLVEFGERDG